MKFGENLSSQLGVSWLLPCWTSSRHSLARCTLDWR